MADELPNDVLLDHTRDKIVVIDENGVLRYANAAVRDVVGLEPSAFVGRNVFEWIHPDDLARVRETFTETVDSDGPHVDTTIEYRHRTADGSWIWLESRFSNLRIPEIDGYVVSSRDVTDRIEAERERDEVAERFAQLAGNATDVLWMFSADWEELLFVNPAYESLYGGSIDEAESDPSAFLECVHPDDREMVLATMDRISAGERVDMEYRVNPGLGYNRWVWVQGQPVVEDGEVTRIVGFSRDVTDRKRRERQLAVLDNVLRHNLRNDLNKILGYTERLKDDDGVSLDECVRVVRRVCEGLLRKADKQRQINRILTESPDPDPIDLVPIVERAVRSVEAVRPNARIETDLPATLSVEALAAIEAAVAELIENAAEYDEKDDSEGARIRVSGERVDGGSGAVLEVVDDNSPIPEYDYHVLTGDQEMTDVHHSSGLGLWIVYWVVDLSNGSVTYERVDDHNVVRVRLPGSGDETTATDSTPRK